MIVLEARAPSVARPGLDVGLAIIIDPFPDAAELVFTAELLQRSIVRTDPAVDPAAITYKVERRDLGDRELVPGG